MASFAVFTTEALSAGAKQEEQPVFKEALVRSGYTENNFIAEECATSDAD